MGGHASSTIHAVEVLLLLVARSCLYLSSTLTTRSLVKKNGLFMARWKARKLQEQYVLWDTSQGISQETEIGPFSIMLAGMLRFWSYYTIPLIRQKRHMNIRVV